MIVWEEKDFAFVHNPKTGGSTVADLLAPHVAPSADIDREKLNWQFAVHSDMSMHSRNVPPCGLWTLAFVRNPYGRYTSGRDNENGLRFPPQTYYTVFCDHIARFEDFEDEIRRLCFRLQIPFKLPKRNASPERKPITEEEAALVYDFYREDFDEFSYKEDSWREFT